MNLSFMPKCTLIFLKFPLPFVQGQLVLETISFCLSDKSYIIKNRNLIPSLIFLKLNNAPKHLFATTAVAK